ncbi:MAG: hypothetical protein IRZ26_05365, partial [Clostridia bacterium]|nr:hypothetical protein [Clostridia bacterium]
MAESAVEQVARELRAILRQESRDGFRDRTVVGGLEAYARRRLEPMLAPPGGGGPEEPGTAWLAEAREVLRAYGAASPEGRRELAAALLRRLGAPVAAAPGKARAGAE